MKIRKPNYRHLPLVGTLAVALASLGTLVYAGPESTDQVPSDQAPTVQEVPGAGRDFQLQDKNGDGAISIEEFTAQHYPEQAFHDADGNNDGSLDLDEYTKARSIADRVSMGEYLDDAWITTKVKSMLVKEQHLAGLKIGVETHDGVVQLSGWVDDARQSVTAADIASQVTGVKRVENDLQVES